MTNRLWCPLALIPPRQLWGPRSAATWCYQAAGAKPQALTHWVFNMTWCPAGKKKIKNKSVNKVQAFCCIGRLWRSLQKQMSWWTSVPGLLVGETCCSDWNVSGVLVCVCEADRRAVHINKLLWVQITVGLKVGAGRTQRTGIEKATIKFCGRRENKV